MKIEKVLHSLNLGLRHTRGHGRRRVEEAELDLVDVLMNVHRH